MHDTKIKMKDGRTFCGPLWYFRPREGWITVVDDNAPEKIQLADIESAVTVDIRVSISRVVDVGELQRARESGWVG